MVAPIKKQGLTYVKMMATKLTSLVSPLLLKRCSPDRMSNKQGILEKFRMLKRDRRCLHCDK